MRHAKLGRSQRQSELTASRKKIIMRRWPKYPSTAPRTSWIKEKARTETKIEIVELSTSMQHTIRESHRFCSVRASTTTLH